MKKTLRKLKLLDDLTVSLKLDKTEFVDRLSSIVDEGSSGMFSSAFEIFSSSKNEYKGAVNTEGFRFKRRRRMFDVTSSLAFTEGSYKQEQDKLIIQAEISGFTIFFIIFLCFLCLFYLIPIVLIISFADKMALIAIPVILVHGALVFCIPYFIVRRGVKKLKYDLEREFFYLTKND